MNQALLATVGFSFFYGLQIVLQQLFVRTKIEPLHLNLLSYVISFVLITLFGLFFNRRLFKIKINKKVLVLFILATILWLSSDLFTVYGLKSSSSINVSLLSRLQIIISFVGAAIFLNETVNFNKIIAVILSLIGGVIVVYNFQSNIKVAFGDILFLLAVISISISGLLRQKVRDKLSSFQLTYLMFGLAAIILGIISLIFLPVKKIVAPGFVVFNAIIGLVGFNLVNFAIQKGGAAFFSVVSNLLPVFTIIFSFIILKNLPFSTQIIGGIIIIISIFLFQKK